MTDKASHDQNVRCNIPTKGKVVGQLQKFRQDVSFHLHTLPGVVEEVSCTNVISVAIGLLKQIDNLTNTINKAIKEEEPGIFPSTFLGSPRKPTWLRPPVFRLGERVTRMEDAWKVIGSSEMRPLNFTQKNIDASERNKTEAQIHHSSEVAVETAVLKKQRALTPIYIDEEDELRVSVKEQNKIYRQNRMQLGCADTIEFADEKDEKDKSDSDSSKTPCNSDNDR